MQTASADVTTAAEHCADGPLFLHPWNAMMLPSHQTLRCRLDERRLERVNSLALDDLDAEGHHVDVTPDGGVLPLGRHVLGLCCIFEPLARCLGVPHVAILHLDVLYACTQIPAAGHQFG